MGRRGAATGTDAFNVDLTEVTQLAEHLRGPEVNRIIGNEMINAGQRSGRVARDNANKRITNKSGNSTGALAKSAKVGNTAKAGLTFSTDVVWSVKNVPFDYAKAHDDGRKAFSAAPGKTLRFEAYGKIIFAKSVKAAAGSKFSSRGLAVSIPTIQAEHDKAARNIARRVEALQ